MFCVCNADANPMSCNACTLRDKNLKTHIAFLNDSAVQPQRRSAWLRWNFEMYLTIYCIVLLFVIVLSCIMHNQ